jgi:hypothetical protein
MTGSPHPIESKAVTDAALNLFGASSTAAFKLPIPGTNPPVFVVAGEAEQIRSMIDIKESIELRFEGYSDDTFGEVEHFKDDYDNYASGEPIEYLVLGPAVEGEEQLGIVVTGQHCPGNSGTWMIGVANYDPDYSDRDLPRWPMRIEAQDYRNGFQPSLVIEAPIGTTIKCLQRKEG